MERWVWKSAEEVATGGGERGAQSDTQSKVSTHKTRRESHEDGKRGMMGNSSGIIEAPAELAALGCRKTSVA